MMIKKLIKYTLIYAAVMALCVLLLWGSTLFPQDRIDAHVAETAERLSVEGPYAYILDGRRSSMLDNCTDAIIFTVCKSSGPSESLSFLTNSMFDGNDTVRCFMLWAAGYVLMWTAKLALTSLFTPYDGFANGFNEFRLWTSKASTHAPNHTHWDAFRAVFGILCPDGLCKEVFAGLGLVYLAALLWAVRNNSGELLKALSILVVGLLPVLWFACTARPTVGHAFFQYRNVGVLFWAMGAWLAAALPKNSAVKNCFRGNVDEHR